MPFELVSRKKLSSATLDLQQTFSQFADIYIPPSYVALCKAVEGLEAQYQKSCDNKGWLASLSSVSIYTNRPGQIQCLSQLLAMLPPLPKDSTERSNPNKAVLLGALLYRYLRLKTAGHSVLCSLLAELLDIRANNRLDPQTIFTCCTAYRHFLKKDKNSELLIYVKNDHSFFEKLDAILNKAKAESAVIEEQLKSIYFVQSVLPFLETFERPLVELFSRKDAVEGPQESKGSSLGFFTKLGTELNKKSLNMSDIKKGMIRLQLSPDLILLLETSVYDEALEVALEVEGPEAEVQGIEAHELGRLTLEKISNYCHYALLGAYVLALDQAQVQTHNALQTSLNHAIGSDSDNVLDNNSKYLALKALGQFVEASTHLDLDLRIWGSAGLFKKELTKKTAEAAHLPKEPLLCPHT